MTVLYDDNELTLFNSHISGIMTNLDKIVGEKLVPTTKEINTITKIIIDFVKDKKRKVYGGSALNLAIKTKKPEAAFYVEGEPHDLDVYSPEPIKDVVDLCTLLHKNKFENVVGREAIHKETYSVAVNNHAYCDFSYVPKHIYNHMPFLQIEGFTVTHPQFMWIDYLRMFIDPMLSHFRWDKSFKRFYLLQKYYPIRQDNKSIRFKEPVIKSNIQDIVFEYLKKSKTVFATGQIAYNAYVDVSHIDKKYISKIPITKFELIATEYKSDVLELISQLQKAKISKIQIREYYPFFQFTGFSTEIMINNMISIQIFDYNKICIPYIEYKGIRIGSFHFNLMKALINAIYSRVNDNKDYEIMYFEMAAHLIQMRRYFMMSKDKNFLDDTVFKDFSGECIGFTQDLKLERLEERKITKGRNTFNYYPDRGETDISKWFFMNSSGNVIRNQKNYLITIEPDLHTVEEVDEEKK